MLNASKEPGLECEVTRQLPCGNVSGAWKYILGCMVHRKACSSCEDPGACHDFSGAVVIYLLWLAERAWLDPRST